MGLVCLTPSKVLNDGGSLALLIECERPGRFNACKHPTATGNIHIYLVLERIWIYR